MIARVSREEYRGRTISKYDVTMLGLVYVLSLSPPPPVVRWEALTEKYKDEVALFRKWKYFVEKGVDDIASNVLVSCCRYVLCNPVLRWENAEKFQPIRESGGASDSSWLHITMQTLDDTWVDIHGSKSLLRQLILLGGNTLTAEQIENELYWLFFKVMREPYLLSLEMKTLQMMRRTICEDDSLFHIMMDQVELERMLVASRLLDLRLHQHWLCEGRKEVGREAPSSDELLTHEAATLEKVTRFVTSKTIGEVLLPGAPMAFRQMVRSRL